MEASSPMHHMTELLLIVQVEKPIVFLYSDGGPDHRLTYISVQLTLISFFVLIWIICVLQELHHFILGVIQLKE